MTQTLITTYICICKNNCSRNNNEECTFEGHSFGKSEKNSYSVSEALSADDSLLCNKDMKMYLSHINSLRLELKKRYNNNLFSFSKFLSSLRYYDKVLTVTKIINLYV